jgi:hypothetical protein
LLSGLQELTMNTKLLAVLIVGAAAVVAAGSGAYLAVRQHQTGPIVTETVATPAGVESADAGVAETEEALTLPPEPSTPAPASAATPAPTRTSRAVPAAPAAARPSARPQPRSSAPPQPRPAVTEPVASSTRPDRSEDASEAPMALPPIARAEPEPAPAPVIPAPREPEFQEITVPADAVIGLQIENNITSETARIEDRVDARVTRDVRAAGMVAFPAGSKVQGSVTLVDKGGKVKERARLGVRFHTLVLADGTRVPIQTETILREGESPTGGSAAKIGGAAVGGAIIGAILGGGKGAAIGGSVGAAGGTAAVMAGSRNAATLNAGSTVTARLSSPATVTVERPRED